MFQGWRIQLREAENAFRQGRLEEAGRLLAEDDLRQFLPAQRLLAKVARRMAQRARRRVLAGETSAGWRDLETAGALAGDTEELDAARQELASAGLDEAETCLKAANYPAALAKLERLERRRVHGRRIQDLKEIARRMQSAHNLSLRGKFTEAESQLASAAAVRPDWKVIAQQRRDCQEKLEKNRELSQRLHGALSRADWTEAVSLADQMLEFSPENALARDARSRAWAAVGAPVGDSRRLAHTQVWSAGPAPRRPGANGSARDGADAEPGGPTGARFLLWIDAVGGYLVCLGDQVVLGQAAPGNDVDVPFQADLSRRHAKIERQGEGYVIRPLQSVRVACRPVHGPQLLSDGDEIELGPGVRLRFRQPHALSATARLEFLSPHRTLPSADGVLLMAESCVLGPQGHNHIVCRDWSGDVVLYRQEEDLCCRAMAPFEIDGRLCDGRGRISPRSHVAGDDFSLSLEELP